MGPEGRGWGDSGEDSGCSSPQAGCLILACPRCVPDLAQLRKKFEEDKQRIELMRAQRKFRPY